MTYLGQTAQVTQQALASSTLKTVLSYLPNAGDRRLSAINNTGLTAAKYLNMALTSNAGGQVTGVTETSDLATVYPVASSQSATINNLNQITALSGTTYTYDLNGNLTGDGVRTYGWDGESRLVRIGYATPAGKLTTMSYDGLSRRTSISSKPNTAGAAVVVNYIWCGTVLCQARSAAGAVTRRYLAEGEYVPGTTPVKYYYASDQVGSVRRVFASNGTSPAYAYDPYGNPLQTTAKVTDMGYAGMFTNKDSGLNLTLYRGYNPNSGRWLSRDPVGEAADPDRTLYGYVGGDAVNLNDPLGLERKHLPAGPWISCGAGCRIRIDRTFIDGQIIRHLHWECKGDSGECGEFGAGSHSGTWDNAPARVKDCARQHGFNGDSSPSSMPKTSTPPDVSPLTGLGIGLGVAAGVCIIVEPCGAAVAGFLGLGTVVALGAQ